MLQMAKRGVGRRGQKQRTAQGAYCLEFREKN